MGAGNCLFFAGKMFPCTETRIRCPKTIENGNGIEI